MPKLKFILIQVEGDNAADHLRDAIAAAFPDGIPAGCFTATAAEETAEADEVDDPTELEPLDEPTELADEAPVATRELPTQDHAPRGSVIAAGRERAIEYLRRHGPRSRAEVGAAVGIAKGSIPFAFKHRSFVVTAAGLLWLAGEPEPGERRSIPLPPPVRPVIVPPRPERYVPSPRQKVSLEEMIVDAGAVGLCRDAIAAEFTVMEPQTIAMLVRRTKFSEAIVREALASDRFRKTTGGYALV